MKKFLYLFITIIFFIGLALSILFFYGYKYLKNTYPNKSLYINNVQISLNSGESLKVFAKKLKNNGIIDDENLFYLWVRYFSDYSKYQKGPYMFDGKISPIDIDEMIKQGKIYEPVVFKITVPEGFNFKQICEKLVSLNDKFSFNECYNLINNKELIQKYNIESETIEGFLFPLTYSFTKIPTEREVVETMLDTFFKKLPSNYNEEISKVRLSLKDAVTFASLIELESADPNERNMISGVIWNRLRARMPLGIDASLIYGIKDYNGNIRKKDLKDNDNKFNTRMFVGLPPTPIASPSLESLLAVVSPIEHKFYYYVLDYQDKKTHLFSKNLHEHNILVKKLVRSYKNK